MRLIDADELLEKVYTIENGGIYGDCEVVDKREIDNAPTVIPEDFMNPYEEGYEKAKKGFERPTGEWKDLSDGWQEGTYECSNCKTEFVLTEGTPEDNEYHYCPNCGAKMKGDSEE